eukprot:1147420-Pelagomonas_calceolata.AAC.5
MTSAACMGEAERLAFLTCVRVQQDAMDYRTRYFSSLDIKQNTYMHMALQHVANYMRTDEERAFGGVLKGGEASEAKVCGSGTCCSAPA